MQKMIIASHSTFAKGLKETLKFLTGLDEQIISICAYTDKDSEDITSLIDKILNSKDEFYILTDMSGGSVNQKFYPYISEDIHVVTGVNLPLAISIALQLNKEKINIEELVNESQRQIIYLNNYANSEEVEDE